MTTWMTERWVEPYGFGAHASALLWLVSANEVTEQEIVDVISAGARAAGDDTLPDPVVAILGSTDRPTILRELENLSLDGNTSAAGEVLLCWLATSELPPRVLGASAAPVIRLLGTGHPVYHELAVVDEMHDPETSTSEAEGDLNVLEAFRRACAAVGAADESLALQRRIQAASVPARTPRRGIVRWLRERRRGQSNSQ